MKSAIRNERKKAIGVALGISTANALYIVLCLVGVGSLLASSVLIMISLKVAGGLFLIYLAFQYLYAKKSDYAGLSVQVDKNKEESTTFFKEFTTGFTIVKTALNKSNV